MIKTVSRIALIGAAVLAAGCANTAHLAATKATDTTTTLRGVYQGSYDTMPTVAMLAGSPAILSLDAKGVLQFKHGAVAALPAAGLDAKGFLDPQLQVVGQDVYATWWTHYQSNKRIFLAESTNGGKTFAPAQVVSAPGSQPLNPYFLLTWPKGGLGLLTIDERASSYHIFYRGTAGAARDWQPHDVQLDTGPLVTNPSGVPASAGSLDCARDGDSVVVAWTTKVQTATGLRYRVVSRSSSDDGAHWAPVRLVYEGNYPIDSPHVTIVADHTVTVAFAAEDSGVHVAVSTDGGQQWNEMPKLADSALTMNTGVVTAAGRGAYAKRLFLAWTARNMTSKTFILGATFDLGTRQWLGGAKRLDTKRFEQTQSYIPSIAANDQGQIAVTWVDYRNILPNIYISATIDGGLTWLPPRNTQVNGLRSGINAQIYADRDGFLLAHEEYDSVRDPRRDYYLRKLVVHGDGTITPLPVSPVFTEQQRAVKLKGSVDAFWRARLAGDNKTIWQMLDPSYQVFVPEAPYLRLENDFKYYTFKVLSETHEGNVAHVTVETSFSIPGTYVMGHKIAEKTTTTKVEQTWVWIHDNWREVFVNPLSGAYIQY